jgi:hypothetical protein
LIYTLAADGSSDAVLIPIISWCLRQCGETSIIAQWVDFGRIPRLRSRRDRLKAAVELYPCDVLFVHRDAEGQAPDLRREEIAAALVGISVRHIPVIPVRMTEAWLLANEQAIRKAAGNPNGTDELGLPEVRKLESVPDPKGMLHEALTRASGLNAGRRSRIPVHQRVRQITNYLDDYSCLDVLPAFNTLQREIRELRRG